MHIHSVSLLATLTAAVLAGMVISAEGQDAYFQTNLVANSEAYNPQIVDPNMTDAWGLALRPPGAGGHFWVADAVGGTSVEYTGDVNGITLHQDGLATVSLDTPQFTDHGYAFVTGVVYNSASDFSGQPVEFAVSGPANNLSSGTPVPIPGGTSGSSKFVFVTEDGAINAWRSNTATAMPTAPIKVDYSKTSSYFPYATNSVFTGVAMTQNVYTSGAFVTNGVGGSGNLLFAADQRNNAIQVFSNQWQDVTSSFHFATPATVGGLHPFNVVDLAGHLFVTYAQFNPSGDEGQEQNEGAGLGHIVEYNENGTLARDFHDEANTSAGVLDEPWGVAIAPSTFGIYGGDVLVSNFGDGKVAAFDPVTGDFLGNLKDQHGDDISIDGIWGLAFGNGVSLGDANSLYFTAGPEAEQDGLFGKLTVAPEPNSIASLLGGASLLMGCIRLRHQPKAASRSERRAAHRR